MHDARRGRRPRVDDAARAHAPWRRSRPRRRPRSASSPPTCSSSARGPAGLAAATELARAGPRRRASSTTASSLGGQYYKQPSTAFAVDEDELDEQYRAGRRLIDAASARPGPRSCSATTVWGAFDADHLVARSATERWILRPRRVVIATGAYERGVPCPGWTLPGVMTTGRRPDSAALLSGRAREPSARGRATVLSTSSSPPSSPAPGSRSWRWWKPRPSWRLLAGGAVTRMAVASPALMATGSRYLASLQRRRVPDHHRRGGARTGRRCPGRGRPRVRRRLDGRRPPARKRAGLRRRRGLPGLRVPPEQRPGPLARLPARLRRRTGRAGRRHRRERAHPQPTVWVVGDSARSPRRQVRRGARADWQPRRSPRTWAGSRDPPDLRAGSGPRPSAARFQGGVLRLFAAPVLTDQLAATRRPWCAAARASPTARSGTASSDGRRPVGLGEADPRAWAWGSARAATAGRS